MKKVVKKAVSMTLALAMLVGLMSGLTIQAAAAGPEVSTPEIKNVAGYSNISLTPQEGTNGVEKFALSFKSAKNAQYVVFLLNGKEMPVYPTEHNVYYIDQKASDAAGNVSFTIYPNQLSSGKYFVYVSSASGYDCLASFEVKAGLLGDVDNNGKVNLLDVMKLARYVKNAEAYPLDDSANADVDKNGKINLLDVMKLARYVKNAEAYPLG